MVAENNMSYKCLDDDIYRQFISFIIESINKRFGYYDCSVIEDYEDGMPDNHPDKVYYTCTCICSYSYERDVYPIYKSELDSYFKEFTGLHRQLRIDKLFKDEGTI